MNYLYFLLIIVLVIPASAQTRLENMDQCLEQVRLHNLSLQNDLINQQISKERVKAAWAQLLPQVKAFGTLDDNISLPVSLVPAQFLGGQEGEFAKVQFGTQYTASYGLEASLPLVNVSNWKNVKASSFGDQASQFQYQHQEQTVFEQAVTAYYFALLSREASDLNRDLVNANDSLLQIAEVRAQQGVIEPLEFNRIKSIYLESQYQLRESEGLYRKNINALKVLMGMDQKDSLILSEQIANTIQTQKAPSVLSLQADQTARYKLTTAKALQAEEDWKRQRARVFPELSLFARYARQSFSNKFDLFGGNQPWFDVGVVGLRAEWNLFTGFNRQALIKQTSLQAKIATQESENSSQQIQKEFDELRTNHEVASYGLGRYTEHFQLNRVNYQVASEKYNQGVYTLDQFITVYQEMVRSQNQYLAKLANYLVYDSIITIKNDYQVK